MVLIFTGIISCDQWATNGHTNQTKTNSNNVGRLVMANMCRWFKEISENYSTSLRTKVKLDDHYDDEVGYIWGCLEKKIRELNGLPVRGNDRRYSFEMSDDKVKILDGVLVEFFGIVKKHNEKLTVRELKSLLDDIMDRSSLNISVLNQGLLDNLQDNGKKKADKANNGKMSMVQAGINLYGTVLINNKNSKGESYHFLVVGGGKKVEITNPFNMDIVTCLPPFALTLLDGPNAGMCGTLHSLFRKLGVANDAKNLLMNTETIGKFSGWADARGRRVSKFLDIHDGKPREIPGIPWDQSAIKDAIRIVRQADIDGWNDSIHSYCKNSGHFHEARPSTKKEDGSDDKPVAKSNVLRYLPTFCAMSGVQGVQGLHSDKSSISQGDVDELLPKTEEAKTSKDVISVEVMPKAKEATKEIVRVSEKETPMQKDLRGTGCSISSDERIVQLQQERDEMEKSAYRAEIARMQEAAQAAAEISKLKMENMELQKEALAERNKELQARVLAFKALSE